MKRFSTFRKSFSFPEVKKNTFQPRPYEGDHIYGIHPCFHALSSRRRVVKELFIQSAMDLTTQKADKISCSIVEMCRLNDIPIEILSKHDLNMLSDNRPHQGFILRASPLQFSPIEELDITLPSLADRSLFSKRWLRGEFCDKFVLN